MTTNVNTRELILDILIEINENGAYSHILIRNVLEKYQYLQKTERAFITRICEGTIENMIQIDYIINQFSKVKAAKMKPLIRNLLRMSIYQLKFMDSIPPSAVCNEAVKLAGKRGFASLKGFVNGILRNISRNIDNITYPDINNKKKYLSVIYSMPEWIVEKWLNEYGWEITEKMLKSFLENDNVTIRCNVSKISVEELIKRLEKENIKAERVPYINYALKIYGYDYIGAIESFNEGLFQIQDVSSMLVVECACIKENDNVIDVCAAPGGKCLHVADKLNSTGHVQARDLTENKVRLIEENIMRSGFNNIEAKVCDALVYDEASKNQADVLIADLPCSGLGIIGKKTDIKYKMTEEKQQELSKLQKDILSVVQSYVKPGGILMYSTCTINKEENEKNVEWFLDNYPFEPESLDDVLDESLHTQTTKKGYIQFLPGVHDTDGFFIAKFKKKKDAQIKTV